MASKKDQESQEEDTESDVRSLVSKFECFSGKSSDKGYRAKRPTRSLLKKHGPPKSNTIPDNRKKKIQSPGMDSSDKEYSSQRPTRSLLTERGPPKSNKIPDSRRKETRSPGLERSPYLPKGETEMATYESLNVFQMPLCLIETDSDGKMKAHQNVLAQISQIDHPLNIICIAGPYRTGKSYLLTRLAGFSKGFALGKTIESKTKGIWVWCRPHPIKKDQVLLLLDTEGLGDILKGDKNNDNQILSLGILLSSTMVYNILAKFSNDDLETLSFVTEISKKIKFSDKMSIEESSSNFDRVFPTFILSLRDFTLDLEFEGKEITSDEYLEKVCLKMQPETSQKNIDNNRARLCLMEYFKTRKCFTFDRPGGRDVLRNLEDLEDDDLQREFIKDSKLFTDYVYNECPPKQLNNGQAVNGRRFVIIAEQYVDAIRNGKVLNVMDALATMVHLENKRAVEESVRIYMSGMSKLEYPTPDSSTLPDTHKRCFDEAFAFFLSNSICDEEKIYYNLANSQITKEYENFRTRDQDESTHKSEAALEGLDVVIRQNAASGCYHRRDGYKLYRKDMNKLETDYCALTGLGCKIKNGAGPVFLDKFTKVICTRNAMKKKTDMLKKYHSDNANRGELIRAADAALTKKEKEIEAEKQKVAEAERRQAAEKRLREEQERLREEEKLRNNKAYEQLKQKHEKELQNERDHLAILLEQRREEKERLEKEGFLKEAERVKSNMEKVKKELHDYEKEGALSLLGRAAKNIFSKLKFWK